MSTISTTINHGIVLDDPGYESPLTITLAGTVANNASVYAISVAPEPSSTTAISFDRDEGTHRWTGGRALLPPGLLDGFAEAFSVEVQIGATHMHYPTDETAAAPAEIPTPRAATAWRTRHLGHQVGGDIRCG